MGRVAGRRVAALVGALMVGAPLGAVAVGGGLAGATTSVTLYVSASGSATSGCTSPGAAACKTVQEAVTAAEAAPDGDAVTIDVGAGEYALTSTITITASTLASLTIAGAGATATTLTGGGVQRDVQVTSGAVTIEGVAINRGETIQGGGVYNSGGTMTLKNDTFTTDRATAVGGGVNSTGGTATLTNDTFVTDGAGTAGGGVFINHGTATLTNDTFVTDRARAGGGVMNDDGTATLTNDTFATDGATTGGGVYLYSGTSTIDDSIFSGSTCGGTAPPAGSYDVTTTTTCKFGTTSVKVSAGEPLVTSTLAANTSSGPKTLALPAGSPAIGAVPAAACTVTTDERGFSRPGDASLGGACDAGAYEVQVAGSTVGCPAGASACGSKTSPPGRAATATSGGDSASTSGRGSLAVGTYRKDPVGALASPAGRYFGLYLSTGNRFGAVVVKSCGAGTSFDWWTGHTWAPVVGEGGHTVASAGSCVTVTLGKTSSPSLSTVVRASRSSRFGSVIFGVTTTR